MKSKIKILRIIHTLSPELGGPSNAIIDHSKAMIKKGYIVHIITSDISNKINNNRMSASSTVPASKRPRITVAKATTVEIRITTNIDFSR